jgi:uncharacterized membrane protein
MQKSRLTFVDWLRGGAILVMIETHVFNTMLVPHFRDTAWFHNLTFINGLVAPAFLFISGFVFIIASRRKAEEFRRFGPAFWRQLRRIGLIWVIGYILHLPYQSLKRVLAEATHEDWLRFYQVDILHCIAVGLIVLFAGVIAIKSEVVRRRCWLVSGLVMVLVTPRLWEIDFRPLISAPLAAYFNDKHYSLFPLFPWMGYLFIGAAVASRYLEKREAGRESEFIRRTVWIGGGLIIVAYLLSLLPIQHEYLVRGWRASPLFFAIRLGCVLLLLTACWYFAHRRPAEQSFVLDASRESLFVYAGHLVILYSLSWHKRSLAKIYGRTLDPVTCILAALALMALMVLGAKLWGRLKQRSATGSRVVFYTFGVVLVILFFIRE